MQATPHDSPGTLSSFLMPKIAAKLKWSTPTVAPNAGVIGENWRHSTNHSL